MKVQKNPHEALRKFIQEAADLCKVWINSTQQYPADQLIKVVVKAGVNQRSIESIASQLHRQIQPSEQSQNLVNRN